MRAPIVTFPFALLCGVQVALLSACDPARPLDEHRLAFFEQSWNEAHERGDVETLSQFWADDVRISEPGLATMSKAQALALARSGQMKFDRYTTSDVVVHVNGDAGIVTGKMERVRNVNGQRVVDHWRFTKVWVRRSRRWEVVAFQASETTP